MGWIAEAVELSEVIKYGKGIGALGTRRSDRGRRVSSGMEPLQITFATA